MSYSIAFHLVGIVFWLGGLMILTRMVKILAAHGSAVGVAGSAIKRSWFGFVIPGLVIASISGLYQFILLGPAYYMKQGWFHGKLTLLLALFAITFFAHQELSKFWNGKLSDTKRLGLLHGLAGLMLLLIVFLTIVGR